MFNATATSSLTKMSSLVSGVGSDANIYDDPQDADIPSLLDSRYDADKAQGLKHLIALMAQGRDVSNYFPQVVKGVASQSLEVKKLVYIYLVHYADKRADEALLSVNSFQRDLSDINPMVRAWALRAMSGIKLRAVVPVVVLAVNKCARDPSPYVRRCAANAVYKVYSLDNEQQHFDALVELVSLLLNDTSAVVVGAAAAAFLAVCPDRYSLLRSSFRKICNLLVDVDEWGQVALMEILMGYTIAKHGRTRKTDGDSFSSPAETVQHFYEATTTPAAEAWELKLLLSSTLQLLSSSSSAVVMQAAKVQWFLSPSSELDRIVKPLLFLLRSSFESQYVVLVDILSFSKSNSALFEPFYEDFFVATSDAHAIKALKLDILTNIVTDHSGPSILQELEAYVRSPDVQLAADAVNAIGRCALRLRSTAALCTKGLLVLATNSFRGVVAVQAALALRAIVQSHPKENEDILLHLLQNLRSVDEPKAREIIIWMLGEHAYSGPSITRIISQMLIQLAKTFSSESEGSKLQVLYCFSKVLLSSQEGWDKSVFLALEYILKLGDCDINYDIRDRARMLRLLIGSHLQQHLEARSEESLVIVERILTGKHAKVNTRVLSELAKSIFLSPKVVPVLPSLHCENSSLLPGTISHVVGHMAPGYRPLPEEKSFACSSPSSSSAARQTNDYQSYDSVSDGGNSDLDEDYSTESSGAEEDRQNGDLLSLSDGAADLPESSGDMQDVMPSVDLEAWLGPEIPQAPSVPAGYTLLSCRKLLYEPKKQLVLDFTNADGLEVHYCFTRISAPSSPRMVGIRIYFHNRSSEVVKQISLKDGGDSNDSPAMVQLPEMLPSLEPDAKADCDLQVDFRHTLKIVKLLIEFNGKQIPIKIFPEPGVLLCPCGMSLDTFLMKDAEFSGMHQSSRRVTIKGVLGDAVQSSEVIASRVLAAAHLSFVAALSGDSAASSTGKEVFLYFSGQTLSGCSLCLITVSTDLADTSSITLKVACEDALYGLALLNQLDKALA